MDAVRFPFLLADIAPLIWKFEPVIKSWIRSLKSTLPILLDINVSLKNITWFVEPV